MLRICYVPWYGFMALSWQRGAFLGTFRGWHYTLTPTVIPQGGVE